MKKVKQFFTNKVLLYGLAIILELFIIFVVITQLSSYARNYYYIISTVISIVALLFVMNAPIIPEYKIAWIVPILLLPIFGVVLYLMLGRKNFIRNDKNFYSDNLKLDQKIINEITNDDKFVKNLATYINNQAYYPVTAGDKLVYFKEGIAYFEELKKQLNQASKFIFLEYFIISEGKVFQEILEILKQKINAGVEVRLIYDDFGSIKLFKDKQYQMLVNSGIKVIKFNPLRPIIDIAMNHRTHRKIAVVDGQIAFTGGINLADEYINHKSLYGHWKDTGIMISGPGVNTYTLMFLQMWNYQAKGKILDSSKYLIANNNHQQTYVISFTDTPLDNEALTESVYIKMINNAKDYIYINTPYLIINSMMFNALSRAAKSGVDVRIMIPGVPDKKMVYNLSKNTAIRLSKANVKVYTYNAGFMHAKSMVSDDLYSIIGTANLDYRSLYLHFESSTFAKDETLAKAIKDDFLDLVNYHASLIAATKPPSILYRACCAVMRIIAPLL